MKRCSNYDEFLSEYKNLIKAMLMYTADQVGSRVYAEKLDELVDNHPSEWEEMADSEL